MPLPFIPAAWSHEPFFWRVQKLRSRADWGLESYLGVFAKGERKEWGEAEAETPRKEKERQGWPSYHDPCPF